MYYVETYAAAGCWTEPEIARHETLEDALADAGRRIDRTVSMPPDWMPDSDMAASESEINDRITIPTGAMPVGAWNESDDDECGGVTIWSA